MGTVKPNEIRIGNYIKIFNIVTQIEGYCIWDNVVQNSQFAERTLDEFEPIPLTEEWLEKFGFSEHKPKDYIGLYNLVKDDLYFTLFAVDDDGFGNEGVTKLLISNSYGDELHIKDELIGYVHQLQNLYFALTGEELTIKEAK